MEEKTGRIDTLEQFEKEGKDKNELVKLSKKMYGIMNRLTPKERVEVYKNFANDAKHKQKQLQKRRARNKMASKSRRQQRKLCA